MSRKTWYQAAAAMALTGAFSLLPSDVSTQARPPAQAASSTANRGEAWFYQRCSLCHMGRIVKDDTYQPMGPKLDGVLKNVTPDRETAVRAFIQRGSLRMPGFRYNFTAAEFEELITYLKTL